MKRLEAPLIWFFSKLDDILLSRSSQRSQCSWPGWQKSNLGFAVRGDCGRQLGSRSKVVNETHQMQCCLQSNLSKRDSQLCSRVRVFFIRCHDYFQQHNCVQFPDGKDWLAQLLFANLIIILFFFPLLLLLDRMCK